VQKEPNCVVEHSGIIMSMIADNYCLPIDYSRLTDWANILSLVWCCLKKNFSKNINFRRFYLYEFNYLMFIISWRDRDCFYWRDCFEIHG